VARPMTRLGLYGGRIEGGELARFSVEGKLQHLVGAEIGRIDKAVAAVGEYRMRVAAGRQHLDRLRGDEPIGSDRAYRYLVAAIGGGEQEAAAAIGRDIRHAVRKRGRCLLR